MNVFILTQPLRYNYGGILQNYALQQVLIKKGFSPSTIITSPILCSSVLDSIKLFLKRTVFRFKYGKDLKSIEKESPLKQKPKDFSESYIIKTNCFKSLCSINSFFQKQKKDCCIIVGSDQVWRPKYSPCLPLFFCASESLKTIPHFAYAASFGVDYCEFSKKQKQLAKAYLPFFKAVSVRENNAIDLCRENFDYDKAIAVPDPTLLLHADDYRKLFDETEKKGLTCYFLDYTEQKKRIAERFSIDNDGMAINALLPLLPQDEVLKQKKEMCSIPDWLSGLANAKYVMTDSFHGTVFSILFHRQFIVTTTQERGNARIRDLLDDFGLSERLVSFDDYDSAKKTLETPVDYDAVEQKLAILREKGMSFLNENLR